MIPLLTLAGRIKWFSEFIAERKRGEIRSSVIVVFFMFAVIISICWGWLGEQWLVLACVFAWGFGDAAAALVGKRFGKRFLQGKFIEGRKSIEGTLAMFVVSFVTVLTILLVYSNISWYASVITALLTAAVCAAVELYTLAGMDTITCPFAAAAIILPLVTLWGQNI